MTWPRGRLGEPDVGALRVLVLGAGAVGGYFGGRLVRVPGVDVTFLVRPGRAAVLRERGLLLVAPEGETRVDACVITELTPGDTYDLVILSCKAYDLASAIAAVGPAVGQDTLVLPLLNGLAHFEPLDEAFGKHRVLGGFAHLVGTLTDDGDVKVVGDLRRVTFGPRQDAHDAARCRVLDEALTAAGIDHRASDAVLHDAWEKLAFLAAGAAATCLFRASIGTILATDAGERIVRALVDECEAVAAAHGFAMRPAAAELTRGILFAKGSPFTTSMLRDLQAGRRTEGEHVLGDLVRRARAVGVRVEVLEVAHAHVQAYEVRRLAGGHIPRPAR